MLNRLLTMAVFGCLRPVDNALDPQGPLSQAILCAVINKENRDEKARPVLLLYCGVIVVLLFNTGLSHVFIDLVASHT